MNRKEYRTATDICRAIMHSHFLKDYTVIITGKTGPTGKTTLCKLLESVGVKAFEISEDLNFYVDYTHMGDKNIMIVNEFNESILVVLNRRWDSKE